MSYGTRTTTYTVIDIRKTFESFQADLRMIARRTGTWKQAFVDDVCHDIVKLAEAKYLQSLDVVLLNSSNKPIQAVRFAVAVDGRTMKGDRAGKNQWSNIPGARLSVVLSHNSAWNKLSDPEKGKFREDNCFRVEWMPSDIDTSYGHLKAQSAQTYGNKGYELSKTNFK